MLQENDARRKSFDGRKAERDIIYIDDVCNVIKLILEGYRSIPVGNGEAIRFVLSLNVCMK